MQWGEHMTWCVHLDLIRDYDYEGYLNFFGLLFLICVLDLVWIMCMCLWSVFPALLALSGILHSALWIYVPRGLVPCWISEWTLCLLCLS